MSDTRVGRASDLFGKVRCELHPKQARYQASLQPDSGNIFSILPQRVARALPLPGTTPGGAECPAVTNGGTARDHSPINATASFARSRFISSVFVQRRRLARGACVTMTGKFPL